MNRNDRKVAIAAIVVGTLALIGIFLGGHDDTPASVSPDTTRQYTAYHHRSGYRHGDRKSYIGSDEPTAVPERFPFDPNTADSTQLRRLGLRDWQVRNIYKYRRRGGIYRSKQDFARLYGLTVKEYRELEPYIRISADYLPASTLVGERPQGDYERDTVRYPVKIGEGQHVVLNTADTTQLKKVPGIGTYYAQEIVRHGRWLGGYVSVDQLDEIEGFPKDAKKYFVIASPAPAKLNVNRLSLQELRRHPYINYYRAKAIVDYRRLHGPISSLQELRFSRDFTDADIRRLEPYVTFEP